MPKVIRFLTTLAASAAGLIAFSPRAHAQLETFQTLTDYNAGGIVGFTSSSNTNTALVQTFTNILELQSVTFRFTTTGSSSTAQNFSAYVVEWSNPFAGSNAAAPSFATGNVDSSITAPITPNQTSSDATTTLSATPFETFTVPPSGTDAWQLDNFSGGGTYNGYDVTLNLNQLTDPSLVYGIVLVDTSISGGATSGLGLLNVNTPVDAFSYGYGLQYQGNTSLSSMEAAAPGGGAGNFDSLGINTADYGFSQIVVVPAGNTVPTPEPRDAALVLCAGFVAFLVGRRLLQQDEETLPGAIAA